MKHQESAHQQAYIRWARMHPLARHAYAIPNGGARSRVGGAILKAEGVKPGIPDVHLPVPVAPCASLYIEFKFGGGRPEAHQIDVANDLVSLGHMVVVVWDWAKARDWTLRYLEGGLPPALIVDK